MIDFSDPLTVLVVFVPIIVGIIASWYYINKLILDKNDRRPKFSLFQRKKENGIWFIYVGAPSKPIRNCNATFKGQQLLIRGEKSYRRSIPSGSGCNFDMPNDVSDNDDGMVIIKEGKHKIEHEKFNRIETPNN